MACRWEGAVPRSWRRAVRARVEGERAWDWEGNCWWRMVDAGGYAGTYVNGKVGAGWKEGMREGVKYRSKRLAWSGCRWAEGVFLWRIVGLWLRLGRRRGT